MELTGGPRNIKARNKSIVSASTVVETMFVLEAFNIYFDFFVTVTALSER